MFYLICDDNEEFSQSFRQLLKECDPGCQVQIFSSPECLRFALPDIGDSVNGIFMDIRLENENGIQIAIDIVQSYPHIRITFVTGYGEQYSQAIFECPAYFTPTAFLVKPVKRKLLLNAVSRIKEQSPARKSIMLNNGRNRIMVYYDEIIYISVMGRKVTFHTADKSVVVNGTFSEYVRALPENFVRCWKSYCLNISHIREIHHWNEAVMTDGTVIPVSRVYSESFRSAVTRFHVLLERC